jgi:hypothetical protein
VRILSVKRKLLAFTLELTEYERSVSDPPLGGAVFPCDPLYPQDKRRKLYVCGAYFLPISKIISAIFCRFFFYLKNCPQNTGKKFWTFPHNDFH